VGIRDANVAYIQQVDAQDWDVNTKAKQIVEFSNSDVAKRLPTHVARIDEMASQCQRDYEAELARIRPDVTDIASEYAARRARENALDVLEHSDSPVMDAAKQVENAGANIGAVLDTVKPWLENRRFPTEHLSKVVERTQPQLAAKAARLTKAKQCQTIAHTTAQQISRGSIKGAPPKHLMSAADVSKYDPDR